MYTTPNAQKVDELYANISIYQSIDKSTITKCKQMTCLTCKSVNKDINVTLPNSNVSKATQELLSWHERLGHTNFDEIQYLAHQGYLPKHISTCVKPVCASCQIGKAHKRNKL